MSDTLELLQTIHDLAGRRAVFRADAYFFVLEALGNEPREQPGRGHDAEAVLEAVRRLGRERYGVMAPEVFRAWGLRGSIDFGRVVFHLAEAGLLARRERDALSDFLDKFEFDEAFSLREMRGQA